MTTFAPKTYQQQVLDSVEAHFKACQELPSPSIAFTATRERLWGRGNAYNPLSGFPADMTYFCLRVPTGGGKTWLVAKSVALVNTHLLRCQHSVILWLLPGKPIREQTLRALRDRLHPDHTALREAGPITVMDLDEAKSVTRATRDTSTTIIVATRQAFQVEDEESRKVYQSSGAPMHHFDNLSPTKRDGLLSEGEGAERTTPCSLAKVLRLRRTFVVVDEAHNSRTELAFDMLALPPQRRDGADRHARYGTYAEQYAAQRLRGRIEGGGNDQAAGGAGSRAELATESGRRYRAVRRPAQAGR